jgi:flagellar hook-length control protein FliK
MQLSLDPKELGSVEVTLVSRGNHLHIQVTSNPTAVNLMATQGQELKNQLVSMGFTDVQMQFNMNQQRQQQNQQQHRNETAHDAYLAIDEIPDWYESLEITLPYYA